MSHDHPQLTKCGTKSSPIDLQDDAFTLCGTKLFVSAALTLSQFYCAASASATSTILWPSASSLPFKAVSLPPEVSPAAINYATLPGSSGSTVSILGPAVGGLAGLAGLSLIGGWVAVNLGRLTRRGKGKSQLSGLNKIGFSGVVLLATSTAYGIAVLVFLFLFWRSPTQDGNGLLRSWILNNNLTRIVTVSSLVLRISSGIQVALAMSMLAALALERVLVPLAEAPAWLIQRSGAGGTWAMLRLVVRKMWAFRSARSVGTALLVALLALAELGLQFSSTILVSDLALQAVRGQAGMENVSVAYSELLGNARAPTLTYGVGAPGGYVPFAEARDGRMPPVYDGLDYTGVLHRALLPFQTEDDRLSLLSYSGWATVMDSTFACIAPKLVDFRMNGTNQTGFRGIRRSAAFDVFLTVDEDQVDKQLGGTNFTARNLMSLSTATASGTGLVTIRCTFYANAMMASRGRDAGWGTQFCLPDNGFAHMVVLNLTAGTALEPVSQTDAWPKARNLSDMNLGGDGAWTRLGWKDLPGWSWSFSLCSAPVADPDPVDAPVLLPVNLTTAGPLAALRVQPDRGSLDTNMGFDVADLMDWLGIAPTPDATNNASDQLRGISTLQPRTNYTQLSVSGGALRPTVQSYKNLLDNAIHRDEVNSDVDPDAPPFQMKTFTLQPFSESLPQFKHLALHPVYASLLQRILQTTNRPALAVQSFWTLLYSAYYYDNLALFDIAAPAAVARWEQTLVPTRWTGLLAVFGLAVGHAVLMLAVLYLFLRRTKFAVVRDPWAAFLHASHGDVAEVVAEATGRRTRGVGVGTGIARAATTGRDTKRMLKGEGRGEVLVGVARVEEGQMGMGGDGVGVMRQRTKTDQRFAPGSYNGGGGEKYHALRPPHTPSTIPASPL